MREARNVAVKDFRSSDPYCIVSVRDYTRTLTPPEKQTTVKKSTLNPKWNERLTLYPFFFHSMEYYLKLYVNKTERRGEQRGSTTERVKRPRVENETQERVKHHSLDIWIIGRD